MVLTDPEPLLEKWWPLIRAAAWRWAELTGGADHEDLVQEAALAVWRRLQKEPHARATYLRQVAEHAARDSLCRGRSIERPLVQGKRGDPVRRNPRALESLEALQEKEGKPDKGFVVRPRRDGVFPDPTAEQALAWAMCDELWKRLTARQRQVLELRLQEYNQAEIAASLGIGPPRIHYAVKGIQAKARALWEGPEFGTCAVCGAAMETPRSPPGGNARRYCSKACKCRAYRVRKAQGCLPPSSPGTGPRQGPLASTA